MSTASIRPAQPSDLSQLTQLRTALWPESSTEEHATELALILAGKSPGILPLTIFLAESTDGALLGFIEAGLRSTAEGCDISHPAGYVEGWYVVDRARRQRIGSALLRAAEDWARSQGCIEMPSDTSPENHLSQRAHEALGFSVAERSINYRKPL